MQVGGRLVCKNDTLAAPEVELEIGTVLRQVALHLLEGGQAVLVEAFGVFPAEIRDQVAAVAFREDEDVGTGTAGQHIVAGTAIDCLASGGARNDVVGAVAEGMTVVA